MSCFLLPVYLCIMHLCPLRSRMRTKHLIFVGIGCNGGLDLNQVLFVEANCVVTQRHEESSWYRDTFRISVEWKKKEWKRLADVLIIHVLFSPVEKT